MKKNIVKKMFGMALLLLIAALFVACTGEENNHQMVIENLSITYVPGDSSVSVTEGVYLPKTSSVVPEATITWSSSNETAINPETGAVTRPTGNSNSNVILTATITINGISQETTFMLTVLATGGNNTNPDPDPNPNPNPDPNVPIGYTGIATVADFKAITDYSGNYILTADLDFGNEEINPLGGWNDIPSNRFSGTFDGNGYALKNFTIGLTAKPTLIGDTEGNTFGASLFPRLTGTVRNLNIINAEMRSFGFSGGVAGVVEGGLIEDVYFQGRVVATNGFTHTVPAGGIAGILGGGSSTIRNVFIDAEIQGGFVFVGFNFGNGSNSYAVSESIGDDGNLMFQIDQTTNPDETPALRQFSGSSRVARHSLTSISLGAKWRITDATRPYLARVDGNTPSWAE